MLYWGGIPKVLPDGVSADGYPWQWPQAMPKGYVQLWRAKYIKGAESDRVEIRTRCGGSDLKIAVYPPGNRQTGRLKHQTIFNSTNFDISTNGTITFDMETYQKFNAAIQ